MKNNFLAPSPESLFTDPLDELMSDALRQSARRTVKPLPSRDSKAEARDRTKLTSGFYLPENWEARRSVSLIHRESNTLLGNFTEYVYIPNPRTTKLVRVDTPTATEGTEYVSGDWWLRQDAERAASIKQWIESKDAVIGITLVECGLHCDAAEVTVRLEHGWIARVELKAPTRFTCAQRHTFLILQEGLDVLAAMSLDSKLALKSELAIGESEVED